jgi:orotate phosphoribosyltransferase
MTTSYRNKPLPQELLNLLAARNGHFRLESGHHGNLWLDLDPLFLRPSHLRRFVIELANGLSRYNIEAVCGPLVGGAFLAQSVASVLDAEFYYTERFVLPERDALYPVKYRIPNGLRKMVHGKTVAVVDDVVNAGSAVRGTFAELRACGANPIVIGALLVLGSSASSFFADQNIPLERIAYLPNELWTPSECPLCASQMQLEDLTADRPDHCAGALVQA